MGRGTKLTPEVINRLGEALKAGNYIEVAVEYAGIAPATYYRWLKEAEAEDASELHKELRETTKRARAEAEYRNVALIQQAAQNGTWQASAWWLERSAPSRWGRQQRVQAEITGAYGGPVEVVDAKSVVLSFLQTLEEDTEG